MVEDRSSSVLTANSRISGSDALNSLSSVIVRMSVVLKRTVGDSDSRFDDLSGCHLYRVNLTLSV